MRSKGDGRVMGYGVGDSRARVFSIYRHHRAGVPVIHPRQRADIALAAPGEATPLTAVSGAMGGRDAARP